MAGQRVNLKYDMLVCRADGTNDLLTKGLMFQVCIIFFSQNFLKFFAKTLTQITQMKIKSFECPKSMKNCEIKYLEHRMLG